MLRRSFRRISRSGYIKGFLLASFTLIFLDLLSLCFIFSRQHVSTSDYIPKPITQSVFVASTHWNNEAILRSRWNEAVLNLAKHVGSENIYVSIYESGSWDGSKRSLRDLDDELGKLGIRRTVILENTTHADELAKPPTASGWLETPRGKKELRRIPYLARLRNLSLKPLADLESEGIVFDRILFLNDVVFTTEDVKRLFNTRNGDYAAACSLDFSKPPLFYDTFALRDSSGNQAVAQNFPYFRSSASRNAMIRGEAVPLQSCWNGMAVFDALPFYSEAGALRFRGIFDSLAKHHLEGSECCLIHNDNFLTSIEGVWMNPHVRVGYNPEAYEAVAYDDTTLWPSPSARIRGIWHNRFKRWFNTDWLQAWRVSRRVERWKGEDPDRNAEDGLGCLINEMQVLAENGWAHV